MSSILDIINVPIGWLMSWLYSFTQNYGLAILLLAVLTKLLLIPLGIKQQKGQLSQMKFAPRVRRIQEKYANDPTRQQQEMQKLQAEGYSPTAGCSTLLIQFPILIGIYNVIRYPLQYVCGLSKDIIEQLLTLYNTTFGTEMTAQTAEYQVKIVDALNKGWDASSILGDKVVSLNLDFLGMNLSEVPAKINYFLQSIIPIPSFTDWLWIIPVVSALTAALSTIIANKMGPSRYMQNPAQNPGSKSTMILMNILGPYMSYAIAFSVPAGLGFYWICSNILMAVQAFVLNKVYDPKKYKEQFEREEAERIARRKKKKAAAARIAAEQKKQLASAPEDSAESEKEE